MRLQKGLEAVLVEHRTDAIDVPGIDLNHDALAAKVRLTPSGGRVGYMALHSSMTDLAQANRVAAGASGAPHECATDRVAGIDRQRPSAAAANFSACASCGIAAAVAFGAERAQMPAAEGQQRWKSASAALPS